MVKYKTFSIGNIMGNVYNVLKYLVLAIPHDRWGGRAGAGGRCAEMLSRANLSPPHACQCRPYHLPVNDV